LGQSGQDIGEIVARVAPQPAAALDDGKDGGDFGAYLPVSQVDPVLTAERPANVFFIAKNLLRR
jgi:hypothetical protein